MVSLTTGFLLTVVVAVLLAVSVFVAPSVRARTKPPVRGLIIVLGGMSLMTLAWQRDSIAEEGLCAIIIASGIWDAFRRK
jgi:hypothetical protein